MTCRTSLRAPGNSPGRATLPDASGPHTGPNPDGRVSAYIAAFDTALTRSRSRLRCRIEADGAATIITLTTPPSPHG